MAQLANVSGCPFNYRLPPQRALASPPTSLPSSGPLPPCWTPLTMPWSARRLSSPPRSACATPSSTELLTRGVPGQHSEWKEAPGIGTIPACWDVVRLGDMAEVQTGRAINRKAIQTKDLEVPYLSVANVKDGYLDLGIVKNMLIPVDEIDRYKLRDGDVLFTEGGDADKLGRGTVWRDEIALCLHQNHVFAVRPGQGVLDSDFLASFAASGFGKRYFLSVAKQTTNLASINASQLRLLPVPLPMPKEQHDINTALHGVGEAIEQARRERDGFRLLKAAAADALLTGRVRVGTGTHSYTLEG